MSLTRTQVKNLRSQLQAVLDANGVNGYELDLGNARFSDTECTFKLVAKVTGSKSQAESALDLYARLDGIDPKYVTARGDKLIEYKSRNTKYPYIFENKAGSRYKITREQAKQRFTK